MPAATAFWKDSCGRSYGHTCHHQPSSLFNSGYKYRATHAACERIIPLYAATAYIRLKTTEQFLRPSLRDSKDISSLSTKHVGNKPTTQNITH